MKQTPITIIAPCYNENVTAIAFLESLENVLTNLPYTFCVVIVNDCSTDNTLQLLKGFKFNAPGISLHIVSLMCNLCHQGAIYQGFLYARALDCGHFIVMDADGEDSPLVIPGLLENRNVDIVNVVRSRRRESVMFRLFYRLYRIIFYIVTGRQMNIGNFCLISRRILERAVFYNFNHFAAFLSKQKCPAKYIVADREERIGGRSKMGFRKLFYHAFKSFVEYSEELLIVFLKVFIAIVIVLIFAIGNVVYRKFIVHSAIARWQSMIILGLINVAVLCIGFFVLGVLLLKITRERPGSGAPVYEVFNYDTQKLL